MAMALLAFTSLSTGHSVPTLLGVVGPEEPSPALEVKFCFYLFYILGSQVKFHLKRNPIFKNVWPLKSPTYLESLTYTEPSLCPPPHPSLCVVSGQGSGLMVKEVFILTIQSLPSVSTWRSTHKEYFYSNDSQTPLGDHGSSHVRISRSPHLACGILQIRKISQKHGELLLVHELPGVPEGREWRGQMDLGVLPVFQWKHWFSVASLRMWIHTACMAQSAETEQIMKKEDTRQVICSQFSTDSATLRCQCLQAVRWGAKNMNLETSRPVFTTSPFLISGGTQSKLTTTFEPQILQVWNGDKKNPFFGICDEYYTKGKSKVLSSVSNTWKASNQRYRVSVVGR